MALGKVDIWNMALTKIGETADLASETENRVAAKICSLHWETLLRELLEARAWPWASRQRPLAEIGSQSVTTTYANAQSPYTLFAVPYGFVDSASQLTVVKTSAAGVATTLKPVTDYGVTEATEGSNAYITLTSPLAVGETIKRTVTHSRLGWDHLYALPADYVAPVAIHAGDDIYDMIADDLREPYDVVVNDLGTGLILCCNLDGEEIEAIEYIAYIDNPALFSAHFVDALAWRLAAVLALGIPKDPKKAQWAMDNYDLALSQAGARASNARHIAKQRTPGVAAR